MIGNSAKRFLLAGLFIPVLMRGAPQSTQGPAASSGQRATNATTDRSSDNDFAEPAPATAGAFVIESDGRRARCRAATDAEARTLQDRDPTQSLRFIKSGEGSKAARAVSGLTIQLRGTTQLDSYPQAKEAFLRAAARWEAVILDPITIILDVDFGPTRFGTPYSSPQVLGATSSDLRQGTYSSLRSAMLAKFPSDQLYERLPSPYAPTDKGDAATAVASAASLRMLHLLPATQTTADPAPGIGFNSAQSFDFDPSDGVDTGKYDFDAIATHEMGHVLGFTSFVGDLELHPTHTLALSSWDLFRFRAQITLSAFTSALRALASGGDQYFFDGANNVPLSTGRAEDGSGGDGFQASHWKDIALLNAYVGIMIPALPRGNRVYMRNWDLDALSWLGYDIAAASFNQATIASVSPTTATAGSGDFILTVNGSNFVSGATVLWKGNTRSTTFFSANQVTAIIPASEVTSAGAASVEVVNPGSIPSNTVYVSIAGLATACTPSTTRLCLNGARFGVTATWQKPDGSSGQGTAVPLTSDTGYFWFFDSTNIEVVTKVLNGCGLTNSYWVFAAGLTNVQVTLTYTDTRNGTVKPYTNPLGTAFQPIQDTAAFSTCP